MLHLKSAEVSQGNLAGCVATEEEAICLSHDGDSRCFDCILLSLLDSVKIDLQYVALQPTNKESAAVGQQEAVHILTLIQQVIKYNEAPTGHILEVVLGEKKNTIL